ncbi:UDP-N-acetylglucosamine pyrophosphorylase [Dimargaris verticillata]|uniref:UDP-N-acetylglucosamine diphosphorylase n=1 Tax=Dimargaris verticillata TaxID=2761393 RepID=A0A9W8B6P8_9FUNG|nr:UDP-N-acetylglucosamine pyrophosphorylase [Dimargaris verticillata]
MMTSTAGPLAQPLRDSFKAAGQEQVFTFWDQLASQEQQALYEQVKELDVAHINHVCQKALAKLAEGEAAATIDPLPAESVGSTLTASSDQQATWFRQGLALIAQGKVAVILMAGGQGTRLGSALPKGCYDINLLSHSSLFKLQAQRILRLQTLAAQTFPEHASTAVIPWAIMTSAPTRANTVAHFEEHGYFGLDPANVIFFNQGTLPCLTMDGKIMLETKSKVAEAPDGNGGIYPALHKQKVIADLRQRGVQYVHSYCVDNCMVRVADPVFIAYCVAKDAECGAKVVPKAAWDEPVGVICLKNKRFAVVEYSEISTEMAQLTRGQGENKQLVYGAGNICNHFYTLDFLDKIPQLAENLEHHIAKKKIKHVDLATGEQVAPTKPNGIKLEQFVFDVFPLTDRLAVFEVSRADEFSPLKNAPGAGADCPETSCRDLFNQHIRFAQEAGANVVKGPKDSAPEGELSFEISPLVTYGGEGLEFMNGRELTTPLLVEKPL